MNIPEMSKPPGPGVCDKGILERRHGLPGVPVRSRPLLHLLITTDRMGTHSWLLQDLGSKKTPVYRGLKLEANLAGEAKRRDLARQRGQRRQAELWRGVSQSSVMAGQAEGHAEA